MGSRYVKYTTAFNMLIRKGSGGGVGGVSGGGGKMKYYCQTNPFHCKIAGCNNLGPACIA